jgi:mannose-6-phosphate isomerase-like protein (cupin superfamily)
MEESNRPWGYYTVLDDTINHKVKKIVVFPQRRLSLQRHKHRLEHWYIIQGKASIKKTTMNSI